MARATRERYEPEVERYGGPWGVALAEELFHRQSETALALLGKIEPGTRPQRLGKGLLAWRTVPWRLLLQAEPLANLLSGGRFQRDRHEVRVRIVQIHVAPG